MKKRVSILISGVFLFAIVINGQCPDRDSLWKRLNFLRETKQLSLDEKLKELLHDDTLLVRCSYKKDSVYSFLLMRIGMIYYLRSDFLRAINYIQKAIDFNSANTTNGSVNHKENISNYFYLSIVYDSLNNVPKKIKALDDCIDLAIGLKASSDISCVRALYLKVEYLYNIGDYYNCINVAEICENAARAYGATGTPYDYLVAKSITSSCLGWHVLALLDLHNFQAAEELLTNKIDEYKEAGLENYLGLIYGQLAQVQLHKSNFDKALFYFDQELSCEHKLKNDFSYSSTLMNIGEEIYFKHLKDYNKTLTCYSKALEYIRRSKDLKATGSVDVLYIFGSIANVYIEKGNFDTAFAYFQRAFDQLGPGINETNFLSASVGKLNAYKKIFTCPVC